MYKKTYFGPFSKILVTFSLNVFELKLYTFIQYERNSLKYLKLSLDIKYLNKCKYHEKIPSFISQNFHRYLYNTKEIQKQLLEKEIKQKKHLMFNLKLKQSILKNKLFEYFNLKFKLDIYQNWNLVLSKFLKNQEERISKYHSKKLNKLGITENINTRIKVYNLSSKTLSENVTKILEKGPKYVFCTKKYNEHEDQVEAEYLYNQISEIAKEHPSDINFQQFTEEFEILCKSYIGKHKKWYNNNEELKIIREFSKEQGLVVTKSDKGNSLVVLDESIYYTKGYQFFNDQNFEKSINDNEKEFNSLKRFLLRMKKAGSIDSTFYKSVLPKNFRTPIAYFFAKTHKADFDTNLKFRPIISSYNSYSFELAKEMSGILNKSITQNNKKGTLDFVTKLRNVHIDGNFKMLSLDIESLFPSIPLDETIRYATEVFLKNSGQKLNKSQVEKLFKYCTKNITFKFGDFYFKQLNGIAMGSPLAPALAEVFLTKIENEYINNPSNPLGILFYYRFVDDIFVILPENEDENEFLKKFNSFHKSLKFTMEHEQNNKLSFLDVQISKNNGKLITSWYRKPSNTLMFNPWESHGPKSYKINLIRTMINRLKIICSDKFLFNKDLKRLKESFLWSGYPNLVIEKYFNICLKRKEAGVKKLF